MTRTPALTLRSLALAVVTCAAASAPAQSIRLLGRVERDPAGFVVACSTVRLQSASVSLDPFVGDIADIRGDNAGTAAAPVIEVVSIARSAETFELTGNARPGGELRFRIDSQIGAYYYFLVGAQPGFTPLDPLFTNISGTFFLNPLAFFVVASGPFAESWEVRVPLPNSPALVGLTAWTQAAVLTAAGTAALYLNPDSAVFVP